MCGKPYRGFESHSLRQPASKTPARALPVPASTPTKYAMLEFLLDAGGKGEKPLLAVRRSDDLQRNGHAIPIAAGRDCERGASEDGPDVSDHDPVDIGLGRPTIDLGRPADVDGQWRDLCGRTDQDIEIRKEAHGAPIQRRPVRHRACNVSGGQVFAIADVAGNLRREARARLRPMLAPGRKVGEAGARG